MDPAGDAATYIGGLHSPPVSQPTAMHQDIKFKGEEGAGLLSLQGVGRLMTSLLIEPSWPVKRSSSGIPWMMKSPY